MNEIKCPPPPRATARALRGASPGTHAALSPVAVAGSAGQSAAPAAAPAPASAASAAPSSSADSQCPDRTMLPPPTDSDNQQIEAVLTKILELEEIDTNMYRGVSPAVPRWGRVYGGQTVAQALVASCRTVAPQFVVHSLHSYFLRPGDDDLPIIYFVERLRNGATFASRRVTALQRGQAIFAMTVSFQTPEQGREHQQPMPAVPPPESIKSLMESYRDVLQDPRVSARVRKGLERSMVLPFPVDMRRCVPESMEQRLKPNPPVQRSWMRVQGQLGNSLMMHQCALAYMSDWSLLETSLLPHGLHGWIQPDDDQTLQMASIDHSMWFHQAFRADEWLLYDMDSPAASGGRGLAFGRFFTRDGKLVVTTAQEGLIRVRSARADAAARKARAAATRTAANAVAPPRRDRAPGAGKGAQQAQQEQAPIQAPKPSGFAPSPASFTPVSKGATDVELIDLAESPAARPTAIASKL